MIKWAELFSSNPSSLNKSIMSKMVQFKLKAKQMSWRVQFGKSAKEEKKHGRDSESISGGISWSKKGEP